MLKRDFRISSVNDTPRNELAGEQNSSINERPTSTSDADLGKTHENWNATHVTQHLQDGDRPAGGHEDTSDNDTLLIMEEYIRKPLLDEGDYPGELGKPSAKREPEGKYGSWVSVNLPFKVKHPKTNEIITLNHVASRSMNPNGRLYPVLKGILGREPEAGLDLRELEGTRVIVSINHRQDAKCNVWENIASVRPLR